MGQMLPSLAVDLAKRHFGQDLTEERARHLLIHSNTFAIKMSAARLFELKQSGLSDREAFISYAFSPGRIDEMRSRGFGIYSKARSRGQYYSKWNPRVQDYYS